MRAMSFSRKAGSRKAEAKQRVRLLGLHTAAHSKIHALSINVAASFRRMATAHEGEFQSALQRFKLWPPP